MLAPASGAYRRSLLRKTLALLLVTATLIAASLGLYAVCYAAPGPSVRQVVEFTRIIQPPNSDNDALQSQVSPDGTRAFIVTRKADVATDLNRFEVLLLDVRAEALSRGQVHEPERLLTVESEHDSDDADPSLREARWVGNATIVFRARLHDDVFQVYALDVASRALTQLTSAPDGLVEFAVTPDLKRVVYVASIPNPPRAPGARSLVVGTNSFWSAHFGQRSLLAQQRRYRYFVADTERPQAARPLGEAFPESSNRWPSANISPDGRWAVLARYTPERQQAWAKQFPAVADATRRYGPSLALDPLSYYSRPYSYVARRFVAYRLDDAREQAILDAPDDSLPGSNQLRTDRLWIAGGRSVVIAGTFLPPDPVAGDAQPPARGAQIIEYWPDSGRWKAIASLHKRLVNALPAPARPDAFIAVDGAERRSFVRRPDGSWEEQAPPKEPAAPAGSAWTLRVQEGLNQPPDIVAGTSDGASVRLTRLNPQFSEASWGSIRPYSWKDARGRPWDGGLLVPSGFDATVKHPLVIQTYGFTPTRFYLAGSNEYDGFTSGFAGRAFLRDGILVLAFPWGPTRDEPSGEHAAIDAFNEGVKGAIDALVAAGLVDPKRIGIMGWSATGERVLNLLTFSDAPIRAATMLDGDANTLFSMTITYAVKDGIQNRKEATNEGGPYGESLARWVRNDPSLHTDCITAALRIEVYGPVVHNNWDIYALLRRQYHPVEMITVPAGSHALSRPSERMISLQGNVDWYRFWLAGAQRSELLIPGETAASLKGQYERWHQMVPLKIDVDRRAACRREARVE